MCLARATFGPSDKGQVKQLETSHPLLRQGAVQTDMSAAGCNRTAQMDLLEVPAWDCELPAVEYPAFQTGKPRKKQKSRTQGGHQAGGKDRPGSAGEFGRWRLMGQCMRVKGLLVYVYNAGSTDEEQI